MDENVDKRYREEYGSEWDELNLIEKEAFIEQEPLEYQVRAGEFLYINDNFYLWQKKYISNHQNIPNHEEDSKQLNLIKLLKFRVSFLKGINIRLRKENKRLNEYTRFEIMDI